MLILLEGKNDRYSNILAVYSIDISERAVAFFFELLRTRPVSMHSLYAPQTDTQQLGVGSMQIVDIAS